jgi:hypothetical protein
MTSPARKHFQRVAAAKAAADAGESTMSGDAHQLMLAALVEDRRRLKDIQSIERKIEVKRELLPNYAGYVSGVLESGQGAQDEVLMTVMIWCFDTGETSLGLDIAEYALRHDLVPPDRYQRGTAAIVAEEVAVHALRELDGDHAVPESVLRNLERARDLTADADMHDQIRAKLHKAMGYALRATGHHDEAPEAFEQALEHLRRAVELDDRIGVKKDIERLERELKKQPSQAQA